MLLGLCGGEDGAAPEAAHHSPPYAVLAGLCRPTKLGLSIPSVWRGAGVLVTLLWSAPLNIRRRSLLHAPAAS